MQRLFPLEISFQERSPESDQEVVDEQEPVPEVRRTRRAAASLARDQILAHAVFEHDD